MTIQLAVLKSGEDVIADIKEIRSNDNDKVVSYLFKDPLVLKTKFTDQPVLLTENSDDAGLTKSFNSNLQINFYPWIPLSADKDILCAVDWVVTMVNPIGNLEKLYLERLNAGTGNKDRERGDSDEADQMPIDFNE
jgi:hypothetical protein